MTHMFVAGKGERCAPCARQQDSQVAKQERSAHYAEEEKKRRLTQAPLRSFDFLKDVIVGDARSKIAGQIFRRHHRAETNSRSPVIDDRISHTALGYALAAKPEDVSRRKKKRKKVSSFA